MARADRERRMRRLLLVGISLTLVVVVGLVGYALINQALIFPAQTLAVVNGVEITNEEFQNRVAIQQLSLINQYQQSQQLMAFFATEPQLQQQLQADLSRIEQQLSNPFILGQQVLEQMIQDVLIRERAAELGIEVSEEAVEAALRENFGYFPQGTPTSQATVTRAPSDTPAPTERALTEQAPTPTASPSPQATAAGTARPTATPYTEEAFRSNFESYLATLRTFGLNEQQYRAILRAELLRERLRNTFADEIERTAEQVHARHILVEDQATAEQVLERLEQGDSWDALAAEYSTDQSNRDRGGDLGWFPRGQMVSEFEQAAFEAQVGETVGPVETQFGFHLIQVLGHEDRPLSEQAFQAAVDAAFQDWLSEARTDVDLIVDDNWPSVIPTPPVNLSR